MNWFKNHNRKFFIGLTDKPNYYIHPEDYNKPFNGEYMPRKGVKGACIWKWKEAKEFIKFLNASNVELVDAEKVLNK